MTTPSDKQTDNQPALQPPERIFAVIAESNGAIWATFDAREKAERYPGPRMFEMAPRMVVEYARVVDGVVATVDDPADMTDDELKAARRFHEQQAWRYSREAAKMWRLRLRMGHPQPIDTQMFAELTQRRAKRKPTLQQHALNLINEMRGCPNSMCEHCQDLLFNELESFLKTVEIVLPAKDQKSTPTGLRSSPR